MRFYGVYVYTKANCVSGQTFWDWCETYPGKSERETRKQKEVQPKPCREPADGWTVKKSKQKAGVVPSSPHIAGPKETIKPEGWNGKPVAGVSGLKDGDPCLCLSNVADGKRALNELSSSVSSNGNLGACCIDICSDGSASTDHGCRWQNSKPSSLVASARYRRYCVQANAPAEWGTNRFHGQRSDDLGHSGKNACISVERLHTTSEGSCRCMVEERNGLDICGAPEHSNKAPRQAGYDSGRSKRPRKQSGTCFKEEWRKRYLCTPISGWRRNCGLIQDGSCELGARSESYHSSSKFMARRDGCCSIWQGLGGPRMCCEPRGSAAEVLPPGSIGFSATSTGLWITETNVQEFLGGWAAQPTRSFRIGWRATWIVRARVVDYNMLWPWCADTSQHKKSQQTG